MLIALTVILLTCVGSDYNLLLISRFQGGRVQSLFRHHPCDGQRRQVVTAAVVFATATMSSFVFSDLRVLGRSGPPLVLGCAVRLCWWCARS